MGPRFRQPDCAEEVSVQIFMKSYNYTPEAAECMSAASGDMGRGLFAENASEHVAGFAFEFVNYIAFEAVQIDVVEQPVGVQLGDNLREVKVLEVDALEGFCYLGDVEAVAEFGGELFNDFLNVHIDSSLTGFYCKQTKRR